jgi:AcrR family transcriptional regulator
MGETLEVRRGRPRGFDRNEALRNAMHVFWRHGFDGTSMTQLVEAMHIKPPSIYAAFGSKEELFREAVELYVASDGSSTWQALSEERDVRVALRRMFTEAIRTFVSFSEPRGCLIVLGACHLGPVGDPIRIFLRKQRYHLRDRFVQRLTRAVHEGELPSRADEQVLAVAIMTFLNGISIEAVDGVEEPALIAAADLFVDRLLPTHNSIINITKQVAG